MKKIEDYRKKYIGFYNKFRLVVNQYGCYPNNLEFDINNEDGSDLKKVSLKNPIFLQKWPIKKAMPVKNVDILIHADFQYRPQNKRLIEHSRSSVYVTYLLHEKHEKTAIPLENIRFDYNPRPTADGESHPLIHAHVFSNKRPQIQMPPPVKFEVNWDKLNDRLNSFRLPIPNMNLPSVLCCLVACHLGADKIRDLMNNTEDERRDFPGLAIDEDQRNLLYANPFAGSQWFERT